MEPHSHLATHLKNDIGSVSLSLVAYEVKLTIPDTFITELSSGVNEKICPSTWHVVGLQCPLNVGTPRQWLAEPGNQRQHHFKEGVLYISSLLILTATQVALHYDCYSYQGTNIRGVCVTLRNTFCCLLISSSLWNYSNVFPFCLHASRALNVLISIWDAIICSQGVVQLFF